MSGSPDKEKGTTKGPVGKSFRLTLPRNVLMLGLVSFFTDAGSEMIYPLIPVFLVQTLGASPAILGIVEGVAEGTASLLKAFSGYASDRWGRRKPLVLAGYSVSSIVRPLIGLVPSWPFVLLIRFSDRVGKGIRTSPRDALIADSTPPDSYGTAYSLHRAMDHAGAVVGPLAAFLLLGQLGITVRSLFLLAALPGALAVLAIIFGVREAGGNDKKDVKSGFSTVRGFDGPFYRYLAILFLFTLGNASDAFILLKIGEATGSVAYVPLLWGIFHIIKSLASLPAGLISDRLGKVEVIIAGWLIYAAAYIGFAGSGGTISFIIFLCLYALYYSLTEGIEKALVADMAPGENRGTAFGLFNFTIGIAALPASIIFGFIWTKFGGPAAFYLSASIALISTLLMSTLVKGGKKE